MTEVKQPNPYVMTIIDPCIASWQIRIDQGVPAAITEEGTIVISNVLFSQYDHGYIHVTVGVAGPNAKHDNYQLPLLPGEGVHLREDADE